VIGEIDALGLLLPGLLIDVFVSLLLLGLCRSLLDRAGFYHYTWHPPLVDVALFLLLVWAVSRLTTDWA
jgi:hypothetical protein